MLRSLLFAALAFAFAARPALADDRKAFKDWEVRSGLDGVAWLKAAAIGKAPDEGIASGLELVQARAENSPLHVVIVSNEAIDTGAPVTVGVDGERIVVAPGKLYARDDPRALTIQDRAALDRIGAKLRNGQILTVEASGQSGRITFKVSLAGLAAALLWLDDTENRVGQPRAFVPFDGKTEIDAEERYKFQVAVSLPPDADLPEELRRLPRALLQKHLARGGCENFSQDLEAHAHWSSYRLDPMNTLYELSCWSAAYNFGTRYYLVKGGDFHSAEPLMFASWDGSAWTGTDTIVNAEVDAKTGRITEFNKYAGVGGCGSTAIWQWNDGNYRLEEYRVWADCDHPREEPEKWPLVFGAKPKRG